MSTGRSLPGQQPEPLVTGAFLVLCVSQLAFLGSDRMLWVMLPLHLQALGLEYAAIGAVLGVFTVSSTLFRPMVGRAVDRWGTRWFLLAGAGVFMLAPLGYLVTASFLGLFGLRLVHGIGPALFVTACYTRVSQLSPPQRLGEGLTYITMANNVAMALGPAGGVYVARTLGFSPLCLAAAGVAAAALLAGLWPASSARSGKPDQPLNQATVSTRPPLLSLLVPVGVIFLALMSFGTVMSFFPLFAAAHGVDNPGVFFSVMAVTLVVVRALGGRVTDSYSRIQIIVPSLALMAAGMFLLASATSGVVFNLVAVLCGSGVSLLVPTLMAAVIEQAGPASRGWAIGIFTATMDLSMAVGTISSGLLLHLTAAYPLVFVVSGGGIVLSLAVYTFDAKRRSEVGHDVS